MECYGDFDNQANVIGYGALGSTTLRVGSRGSDVTELQNALNSLGFNAGAADGAFGSGTRGAVINFQSANGLTPDGIVGPKTAATLKSKGVAISKPSSVSTSSVSSISAGSSDFAPMSSGGGGSFFETNKLPIIGGGLAVFAIILMFVIKKKGKTKQRVMA